MIQGAVPARPSQRRNANTIKRSDPKPYRRNSAAAAPVSRLQGEEDFFSVYDEQQQRASGLYAGGRRFPSSIILRLLVRLP